MRQINVGIVGVGWCGGIRAHACAANPLVKGLYLAEIRPDRLAEAAAATKPVKATTEWRELLDIKEIDAIYISATPETTHYPMARECLLAGKHVFLEKPIAMELGEADELIAIARRNNLKFTVGYSQRFSPKQAYIKKCVTDGTLGQPVTALVSRHITRSLGDKINTRTRLSPAAMEATHDIDWVLWCLEPAKPVRVYTQSVSKVNKQRNNTPDQSWIMITMDNDVVVTVGAGWILPPAYPNFSTTQIELYWEPIRRDASGTLILNPGEFYILVSKEKVRVPPGYAAEMVPYDPSVGEFRIHYAGFFDPGFGYGTNGEIPGTRAVLEVRSHEVPFLVEDGQVVGRLIYERLTDLPEKLYGSGLGSNYQRQGLALSKQFKRA